MAWLSALSFSTPLILAALAALPAIWLLLRATPPSPTRIRFPAFIILRQLQDAEQTPDRTPWWLLLLRLLITALVIIALAGPVLNAANPTPGAGPMVLVVDDTFGAAPGWRARSDAMQTAIAEAEANRRAIFLLPTAPALDLASMTPLTAKQARDAASALQPKAFRADRNGLINRLGALDAALATFDARPEIRWLSDAIDGPYTNDLARALEERGDLAVYANASPLVMLRASQQARSAGAAYRLERLHMDGEWTGDIVAAARDGRELMRQKASINAGDRATEIMLDLPLALRNEVASVRIDGGASAAAIRLADARDRKALIGLVDGDRGASEQLLTGVYYVQKALQPYGAFLSDTLENLLASDVSVIVLDDVGRLRAGDADALGAWIEEGGVVIRFAGPNLADAAQDATPALMPVALRGGGRAFGGALSWETPQPLGAFSPDGPFAALTPPDDVRVRRQVLANPGGETSLATWASLEDGTPLVTGVRRGEGALVLFHVTATPAWSDLPISAIFIEMLRKLTLLSVFSPDNADTEATARFAPLRMLDGFGRFEEPSDRLAGVTAAQAAAGPSITRPPGLYGAPDAPLAINTIRADETITPLTLESVTVRAYETDPPTRLAPLFFILALLLFLLDGLAALLISGRLRPGLRPDLHQSAGPRATTTASLSIMTLATLLALAPGGLGAQPLDPAIDSTASAAALETRLAYVRTGDRELDRISDMGLAALSRELFRRTAIEPAAPAAIDLETDDLSVYPFLYWPIAPGATPPSEAALANIENFMRFGGLVVFDTRDDERAVAGLETPERASLRAILSQLDVPPLTPLPVDHVLTRSFYLLEDLPGRVSNNPVWVQASGAANDAVTPLIISGRDWAGAWAVDAAGRPLLPIARGRRTKNCSAPIRECVYRAGINIIMVAFTGNYKSDQVHTPVLLKRLGREQ